MKMLVVLACLIYIISPIDFIPDIPIVGWGDDLVAAFLGLKTMLTSNK